MYRVNWTIYLANHLNLTLFIHHAHLILYRREIYFGVLLRCNVHKVQGTEIMTSTMIVLTMISANGLVPWYKMEYLK